jgi:hypothetical protein
VQKNIPNLCNHGNRFVRIDERDLLNPRRALGHDHSGMKLALFSKEVSFSFPDLVSPTMICETVKAFVMDLCRVLKGEGCKLIGHIKVLLNMRGAGFLFLSATSFDQVPNCKGHLEKDTLEMTIAINAIVYGFEQDLLEQLVSRKLQDLSQRFHAVMERH